MWKESHTSERSNNDVTCSEAQQAFTEKTTIGPSLRIKGSLSGGEDLLIQGQVEGQVTLEGNELTVGPHARIKANLNAKVISVEGEVRGNLFGREKIAIQKTGDVEGDLVAPRVKLEDGATFKGNVNMEAEGSQEGSTRGRSKSRVTRSTKRPEESATSLGTSETAGIPLAQSR